VTLTATNTGGTGTTTKTGYIVVHGNYADVGPFYTEGFENASEFYSRWTINDLDGNSRTWYRNNNAAYTGSYSCYMNPYYSFAGDVDQLISPSYDLSFVTGGQLTFKCAAATNATAAADMNDQLRIWKSTDCGMTWGTIKTLTGVTFLNNSYHPEEFVPSSASQWVTHTANIGSTSNNIRFKFEYTTGNQSNSIYIDDINISGTVGMEDNTLDAGSVSLYPNPSSSSTTLFYHLVKDADVKIEMIDVLGKKVMEMSSRSQAAGDYNVQISKQELGLLNGIYLVKISVDNQSITKKLVISE
jgi:hypothetical protein